MARVTAYTLPPHKYQKAREFNRLADRFYFLNVAYDLLVLLFILRARLAPKYRDWVERVSPRLWVQAIIFALLLLGTIHVLELPPRVYGHVLSARYGISIERWPAWLWDWSKEQLVALVAGAFALWLLYAFIRGSPRRWWLYAWMASVPVAVFLVFIQPLVVDLLFYPFEPLAASHPALVESLEKTVSRAGLHIPPERMFEMKASAKTTALNAYVTGLGGSQRVVVYDTTMASMSEPQVALVFGHEMGHYVLGHVWQGLAWGLAIGLFGLLLAYHAIGAMVRRWGTAWRVRGVDDLASLPALLLLLAVGQFLITPGVNAVSRHLEHQADVYGLEVAHGVVPDSSQVMAQALEILGETDLEDPAPSLFVRFWLYDHPWIADRIRFALTYDPWAAGSAPQFVN